MTSLAASSSNMQTVTSMGAALHQSVDHLIASSSHPLHLQNHRETFQERALRDVTTNSNDSAMMLDPSNPLLVKDEMEAQKDYFRRLKFTYLEQEAKRNFLFSITGDEPQSVQPGENEERERTNKQKKAALKATKAEIEAMKEQAIQLAKSNAAKQSELSKQVGEVQGLQKQIREMELELQRIRATHPTENRMTISQAETILDEQTAEMERLTEAIGSTAQKADVAREDVAKTGRDIQRLGREREREEARAKEVQEGREAGDTKVDELCRWLSSSITFYKTLVGVRSVKAVSDHELHIEYDLPSTAAAPLKRSRGAQAEEASRSATLALGFDPRTQRLIAAQLLDNDMEIEEAVNVAVSSNDVAGLIADLLVRLRPMTA